MAEYLHLNVLFMRLHYFSFKLIPFFSPALVHLRDCIISFSRLSQFPLGNKCFVHSLFPPTPNLIGSTTLREKITLTYEKFLNRHAQTPKNQMASHPSSETIIHLVWKRIRLQFPNQFKGAL